MGRTGLLACQSWVTGPAQTTSRCATDSTLMQFLAAPTDHVARVAIWRAPDAIEKPSFGLLGIWISIDHLASGFGPGRLVVVRHLHVIQFLTEICEGFPAV